MTGEQLNTHTRRAVDWATWRTYAVPLLIAAGLLTAGGAPFHANIFR